MRRVCVIDRAAQGREQQADPHPQQQGRQGHHQRHVRAADLQRRVGEPRVTLTLTLTLALTLALTQASGRMS